MIEATPAVDTLHAEEAGLHKRTHHDDLEKTQKQTHYEIASRVEEASAITQKQTHLIEQNQAFPLQRRSQAVSEDIAKLDLLLRRPYIDVA